MTFAEAIKSCYQKYATLSGRASRSEFWYFNLFFYGPIACCGLVAGMMASGESLAEWLMYGIWAITIFSLVNFLPLLAVSVRRLHDVNMSGWWLLIRIVPLLGDLYLLIKFCTKGDVGQNRYGVSAETRTVDQQEDLTEQYTLDYPSELRLECTSGQYKGCKFPLADEIVIGTDPSRCSIVVDKKVHPDVEPVHCVVRNDGSMECLARQGEVQVLNVGTQRLFKNGDRYKNSEGSFVFAIGGLRFNVVRYGHPLPVDWYERDLHKQ